MSDEELVKALRTGKCWTSEAADRIEALERLTRGQEEQLEIQGNELARRASHGHEQAARIEALTAERDELQHVFDFQWKAHMRAVEMWRLEHPDNDLVLPDTAKLLVWLLEQVDEAKALQECGCAYENPTDICAGHHALFERVYGVQRAALEARLEAATHDADEAEAYAWQLEQRLAKAVALVEDAYCEGFSEGYGGGWIEGDYSKPWKKSEARAVLAEIEGGKDG